MSCGGGHSNRNYARISEVGRDSGVPTKELRTLFHALIRARKGAYPGAEEQAEVEQWARDHLLDVADVHAEDPYVLDTTVASAQFHPRFVKFPPPGVDARRAAKPSPSRAVVAQSRKEQVPQAAAHADPAEMLPATAEPVFLAAAAPGPSPMSGAEPSLTDDGPRCEKCSGPVSRRTYSGLCQDCYRQEMRDEAALMDLTGEEAEAWVADETALDIVRDDDVIDGRDPLDIADPDDFALWDDFTAVSGYREQMKGSGTRYGYDDETVDDFYAAQRSMLGEWGDRWGSSGGSGTGSKYSSVGWTFGGGSGGGSYGKQSSWESPESKAKRLGEPVTVAFGKKGSGDGYVYFPDGERRWGIYGASGILLRNVDETGTERFFLAQRGNVSGGAGMWAIPGGALDEGETPVQGAMREFTEEIQVGNVNVTVHGEHRDEYHSSWAYTSVVADVDHQFAPPEKLDWETKAVGWFTREEIADLPKHPGLEKTLDSLFGLYSSKV